MGSYEAGQDWGGCDSGGGGWGRGWCRERTLSHQADMQVCLLQRDGIFQNVALSIHQPHLAAPFPRRRLVVLARHLEMRVSWSDRRDLGDAPWCPRHGNRPRKSWLSSVRLSALGGGAGRACWGVREGHWRDGWGPWDKGDLVTAAVVGGGGGGVVPVLL